MKYRNDLTAEEVRHLLDYDPETGVLTWRSREDIRPSVNARFAGQRAGHAMRRGHRQIRIHGALYYEHRVAYLHQHGEWPPATVDHKNRAKGDNGVTNLRPADHSQNLANRKVRKDNRFGVKGVKRTRSGRWGARIQGDWLGTFDNAGDAHTAYVKAATERFGEFARAA
jgi:hypothetical protein